MDCSMPAPLSFTISQSFLKFMSIESVMPSNHLILCGPLLLLPSIFPSIRVFYNKSALHIRWPKYCSFSFSISPSNEYSGLISFRIYWFDLLAVQGTLKCLLQHHRSKFKLKLKKVGKSTGSFRYDLNQIPYLYTVEERNRFKGFDLIRQNALRTMDGGSWHCTEGSDQDHPQEKKTGLREIKFLSLEVSVLLFQVLSSSAVQLSSDPGILPP